MSYTNVKFPGNPLFLVTGGAGFIGSNLCEAILNLGYRVRCLDDLSTGHYENMGIKVKGETYRVDGSYLPEEQLIVFYMPKYYKSPARHKGKRGKGARK